MQLINDFNCLLLGDGIFRYDSADHHSFMTCTVKKIAAEAEPFHNITLRSQTRIHLNLKRLHIGFNIADHRHKQRILFRINIRFINHLLFPFINIHLINGNLLILLIPENTDDIVWTVIGKCILLCHAKKHAQSWYIRCQMFNDRFYALYINHLNVNIIQAVHSCLFAKQP